jgi:hypothetical protein
LRERGQLYRRNLGGFAPALDNVPYMTEVGTPRPREAVLARTAEAFNHIRNRALDLLDDAPAPTVRTSLPLTAFMTSRPLA